MAAQEVSPGINPATLAVMQNALRQIVDEMDLALERAAFNPVMSEGRDRANGIYDDHSGEVIAQGATGVAIFVGVMQFAVRAALEAFPDLEEGDVVLLNDPYCGGTHLMDVKLVRPFFYRGKRYALLANCGHWTDIGGNVPGGFGVRATEIIQEGIRIPPILLYRKGELQQGVLDLLFANMRLPEDRRGDLKAQIAALNVGEERLRAYLDKHGADTVRRYMDELSVRSETQMRAYIGALPDGCYRFRTQLDSDGIVDRPIEVALAMTVAGDRLSFDFTGSSRPVKGPLNSARPATVAAVFVALKHLFPEVPINGGIFRPVEILLPEDCVLNAKYPSAVSGASAEVALRVVDAVFGCMAQAMPERVPAACFGTIANLTVSGHDPESRKSFIMFRFSGGGLGGHPSCDGLSNAGSPLGATRTSPVELIEQLYPVVFDHYRLRERSAGAGEKRGGLGMEFQARIERGEAQSSILGDRGRFAPYGLHGGKEAASTVVEYLLGERSYRPQHVSKDEGVPLAAGDAIRIATPGGGGWGDPMARDAKRVLHDVRMGYITPEDARGDYGVVIRVPAGACDAGDLERAEIDERATARLRKAGAAGR